MKGKNMITRKRYSKAEKDLALNMYLGGKTLTEVGNELAIPCSTLGTWFKDCQEEKPQEVKVEEVVELEEAEVDVVEAIKQAIERKDKRIAELEVELTRLKEALNSILIE